MWFVPIFGWSTQDVDIVSQVPSYALFTRGTGFPRHDIFVCRYKATVGSKCLLI